MQNRPLPKCTLTLDNLKESENLAIKELAEDDFFIPSLPGDESLAKDVGRKLVDIVLVDGAISQETYQILASSDSTKDDKNNALKSAFKAADSEAVYPLIAAAYRQKCISLGTDALEVALHEINKQESKIAEEERRNPSIISAGVSASPDVPGIRKGVLNAGTLTLFSTEKSFSILSNKGRLADIRGSVFVFLKLTPIEKDKYKAMLEKQKQDYLRQGFKETNNKVKILTARIADEESYPGFLYKIEKIMIQGLFMRDVMMSRNLPDINDPQYQDEIVRNDLSSSEKLKALWKDYQSYIAGQIRSLLKDAKLEKFYYKNREISREVIGQNGNSNVVTKVEKRFSVAAVVTDAQNSGKKSYARTLFNSSLEFRGAIAKYLAVKGLVDILDTVFSEKIRLRPDITLLDRFEKRLDDNRSLISESRDMLSFWKSKGALVVEETDKILPAIREQYHLPPVSKPR